MTIGGPAGQGPRSTIWASRTTSSVPLKSADPWRSMAWITSSFSANRENRWSLG